MFIDKVKKYEDETKFKIINLKDFEFKAGEIVAKDNSDFVYKFDDLSFPMYLERMGLRCPTMLEKAFSNDITKDISEELVNGILGVSEDIYAKAYIRDNELLALHSKDYVTLMYSELMENFDKKLKEEYERVSFNSKGAILSDACMSVEYIIRDDAVCEPYRKLFGNGANFYDSFLKARLVTSNLGFSGANIYPLFCYQTLETSSLIEIPVCNRIVMEHKGEASISKFSNNCGLLFNLIMTSPKELEELDNIKIKYPTHCIINIADKVGITAKQITPIAEMVSYVLSGYTTTGKELYTYLATVIEKATNDKDRIELTEKVAKALRIIKNQITTVDLPKIKWKRLNIVCDEEQDFIPETYQERLAV